MFPFPSLPITKYTNADDYNFTQTLTLKFDRKEIHHFQLNLSGLIGRGESTMSFS